MTQLSEFPVVVPPVEEQRRIAAILDKADAVRRKREEGIRLTEELLRSTFLDMFGDPAMNPRGWDRTRFESIIQYGPQNGLYRPASDYGSGTLIIRIDSFDNGDVIECCPFRRLRLDSETASLYRLNDGDLLINRVNSRSHIGKVALISSPQEEVVFESNMMRIRVDPRLANPLFVLEVLCHPVLRVQIQTMAKDAVNQASINQRDVRSLMFPIPPVELQNEYATRTAVIRHLAKRRSQGLKQTSDLYDALVQRAFRGEL